MNKDYFGGWLLLVTLVLAAGILIWTHIEQSGCRKRGGTVVFERPDTGIPLARGDWRCDGIDSACLTCFGAPINDSSVMP